MPLHLESITNKESSGIFSWIIQNQFYECEDAFATKDKMCAHCSKDIVDKLSQEKIGEYIFTLKTNLAAQANELLDFDIVFKNPVNSQIKFTEKLSPSSDANEYYNAETEDGGRFQIETVNRYLVEGDSEGKVHNVNLSAFPFILSIYDDLKELNAEMGFVGEIKVGETDLTVEGYSDNFVATGDLFKSDINSDETFSFVIGKITKFQNCRIEMNNEFCDFIIVQLNTAVGNLTTVINTDKCDIAEIAEGKIIAMCAYIKANFKLNDKYPKPVIAEKPKKTFWDKVKSIFK